VASVGVLREGPLHAAVKAMLAAPGDRLEVPVGRFVIDLIRADGELVEVQTGGFGPLGAKLDALLDRRFRIVHPVAAERRIVRVDDRAVQRNRHPRITVFQRFEDGRLEDQFGEQQLAATVLCQACNDGWIGTLDGKHPNC
jgi:hypothetical protein